jgi:uncharacterized protein (UPF0332 family)
MNGLYTQEHFAALLGANGDPKLNAAADYAARLMNGPLGSQVARIILYGSVARNQARPDSDVDLMVFAAASREALQDASAEAAWEATVEWGELVSQLTYTVSDLLQPRSYLIYDTLHRGKKIFSMNESEIRQLEIEGLVQKARKTLDQAQRELEHGGYELAMVGAYTAAELAAKALLFLKPDVDAPHSHAGVIQIFSLEYVKTGEAPVKWGKVLHSGLDWRIRALYDVHSTPNAADIQQLIELAQEMLAFLDERRRS